MQDARFKSSVMCLSIYWRPISAKSLQASWSARNPTLICGHLRPIAGAKGGLTSHNMSHRQAIA